MPEMTLQEVADKLGITRQRVEQLEKRALKKLRHPSLKQKWMDIMDTMYELELNKNIDTTARLSYTQKNYFFNSIESKQERFDFNQKY